MAEAEDIAVKMETNEKYINSKKIKKAILGNEPVSIIKYAEKLLTDLQSKGKLGTYNRLKSVLTKLKTYLKTDDINFDDFDLSLLQKYERYLRDDLKNAPNTIHSNLKIFRRLFNSAIREELIEPNLNPFSKFKMSTEKTKKEFLTEDELKAIEDLDLKEGTVMYHHRNMYIFASYAGGIRISDLLQLRWQNFDISHITLYTQKTKDTIHIKLPTKALEILKLYALLQPDRNSTDFIFPLFLNNLDYTKAITLFKAISSGTAYANKNLCLIAKKAGLKKHISFHSSRHTWATRALRKGMRIEYVSKLMGHSSIKTTQIYTKIVNSDLDIAMDVFN